MTPSVRNEDRNFSGVANKVLNSVMILIVGEHIIRIIQYMPN